MPSVTLRFVTGTQRTVDLDDDATAATVRDIVSDELIHESVRVCFKGEALEDDRVIATLGMTDADRLVITGRRNAGAAPNPAAPKMPTPAPSAAGPPPTAAPPARAQAAADGGIAVDQEALASLEAMGFTNKAEASQALRAAFNHVPRAVEYLCTGIPPQVLQQMPGDGGAAPATGASGVAPGAPTTRTSGVTPESLFAPAGAAQDDQLRQRLTALPQYPQMVQLVRENPSTLPEILNQLRTHHNDIFMLAAARPEQFAALLGVSVQPQGGGQAPSAGQGPGQTRSYRRRGPEDEAAIQRLVAMGGGAWDDRAAAFVFIISDRNEERAANILVDNNGLPAELIPQMEQFQDQLTPQ